MFSGCLTIGCLRSFCLVKSRVFAHLVALGLVSMMLRCMIIKTVELVDRTEMRKTDCFGKTRLVPHVPSSSWAGKRCCCYYYYLCHWRYSVLLPAVQWTGCIHHLCTCTLLLVDWSSVHVGWTFLWERKRFGIETSSRHSAESDLEAFSKTSIFQVDLAVSRTGWCGQ